MDSETAKILENTYRAVNIALMAEWGRFAERVGVDIFDVINAIFIDENTLLPMKITYVIKIQGYKNTLK